MYVPDPIVNITNYSNHLDTWEFTWDFGDETSSHSSDQDFTKTYYIWGDIDNDSEIPITLSALNTLHPDCNSSITHNIRIIPPSPEIEILGEDPKGCVPLTVDFSTAYNYIHPDGFEWDFDDSYTSDLSNPSHTFEEPGIYNVKLSVQGD